MRLFGTTLALCACTPSSSDGSQLLTVDRARSEVHGAGVLFAYTSLDGERDDVAILDGTGAIRWRRDLPGRVVRARLHSDGILLALDTRGDEVGGVQLENLDGDVLRAIPSAHVHHDVLELPDGRWVWLEHDFATLPFGADPFAPVASDLIRVAAPDEDPQLLFAMNQHYPIAPWPVCKHTNLGQRIDGYHQFGHSNSLVWSADRPDELRIMVRNLDAILTIDVNTGTFLSQLGGRDGLVDVAEPFDHSHMSQLTASGQLLVFDNRQHSQEPSRVVEIDPITGEVGWSVAHPEGSTMGFLGDAQRLPGGNTLVVWSTDARITEFTPSGDIVWDVALEDTKHVRRAQLWQGALP